MLVSHDDCFTFIALEPCERVYLGGVCLSALSHGDGFCLSCALAGSGLVVVVVVSSSVLDAGLGLVGIWLMRLVGFILEIADLGILGTLSCLVGD